MSWNSAASSSVARCARVEAAARRPRPRVGAHALGVALARSARGRRRPDHRLDGDQVALPRSPGTAARCARPWRPARASVESSSRSSAPRSWAPAKVTTKTPPTAPPKRSGSATSAPTPGRGQGARAGRGGVGDDLLGAAARRRARPGRPAAGSAAAALGRQADRGRDLRGGRSAGSASATAAACAGDQPERRVEDLAEDVAEVERAVEAQADPVQRGQLGDALVQAGVGDVELGVGELQLLVAPADLLGLGHVQLEGVPGHRERDEEDRQAERGRSPDRDAHPEADQARGRRSWAAASGSSASQTALTDEPVSSAITSREQPRVDAKKKTVIASQRRRARSDQREVGRARPRRRGRRRPRRPARSAGGSEPALKSIFCGGLTYGREAEDQPGAELRDDRRGRAEVDQRREGDREGDRDRGVAEQRGPASAG